MSKKSSQKPAKEPSSYEIRDIVLGKVRGYPPWPGMVVDPDSVPPAVRRERPSGTKTTFYCVRFFPAGDYAWLVAKDMSKLQTHEIEAYIREPFKKSGDLLQGYRIALNPQQWEEEVKNQIEADGGEEEDASAEVDELDSENEGGESKKKSKKRKRESDAASTKTKSKNRTKRDSISDSGKKKAGGAAKGKKNGPKSKTMVESEDDGDHTRAEGDDEDAGPSKQATSPPPTKKVKRDKDEDNDPLAQDEEAVRVREWRHKLQKSFLSNKSIPKEEDMPALDTVFKTVENYDKMTIQYLTFSKIGKVMRHIAILEDDKVPRDNEFKFRERAKALVDKWHIIASANKPNGTEVAAKTNGEAMHEAVTDATAALDLNGKPETNEGIPTQASAPTEAPIPRATSAAEDVDGPAAALPADAPGEADTEMEPVANSTADAPGDVSMAEA